MPLAILICLSIDYFVVFVFVLCVCLSICLSIDHFVVLSFVGFLMYMLDIFLILALLAAHSVVPILCYIDILANWRKFNIEPVKIRMGRKDNT